MNISVRIVFLASFGFLIGLPCFAQSNSGAPYLDPNQPIDVRVNDLVAA